MAPSKQAKPPINIDLDPAIQGTHVDPPPLYYTQTALSLREILHKYPLPRVIRSELQSSPCRRDLFSNVCLSDPFLAYVKRSVRKVSAHSLQFDESARDFVAVGNGLLIPVDYPGWFAVMGHPDKIKKSHEIIPHYTKISMIATSGCINFLVGGTREIKAVLIEPGNNGIAKITPILVFPGTVLRKGGLYQEVSPEVKDKKKKKKDPPASPRQFLKCFDKDREILIHTLQTGLFYIISQKKHSVQTPIVQIQDILLNMKFPVVVKLIYGRVPVTPCSFTNVLLLTDSAEHETLVASTLIHYRNINLEIPLGIGIKFNVAQQTTELTGSKPYRNALWMCEEKAVSYIKNIKVVFGNPKLGCDTSGTNPKKSEQTRPGESSKLDSNDTQPYQQMKEVAAETFQTASTEILRRSASKLSGKSYLSLMEGSITSNPDSVIQTEQTILPQSPSAEANFGSQEPLNQVHTIIGSTTFDSPKHSIISTTNIGQSKIPVIKKHAGVQVSHQEPDQPSSSDVPISPKTRLIPQSTITINSKPGQPVKLPVSTTKESSMNGKTSPKPCIFRKGNNSNTPQPTSSPVPLNLPPKRGHASSSNSTSSNDSMSLTSMSDDGLSTSEWSTDEENSYVNIQSLMRLDSKNSENDREDLGLHLDPAEYVSMQQPYDHSLGSLAVPSGEQNHEYLQPVHQPYQIAANGYEAANHHSNASLHGYSGLESGHERDGSGVTHNCEHKQTSGPQLPPRNQNPQQVVLKSTPASSKSSLTQDGIDKLVEDLEKKGIKPQTQIALRSLQMLTITNLLSKDEDFDDALGAMLPNVDKIQQKIIAGHLREMKRKENKT